MDNNTRRVHQLQSDVGENGKIHFYRFTGLVRCNNSMFRWFFVQITHYGYVQHLDWTKIYKDLRAAANIHYPGKRCAFLHFRLSGV